MVSFLVYEKTITCKYLHVNCYISKRKLSIFVKNRQMIYREKCDILENINIKGAVYANIKICDFRTADAVSHDWV